MDNLNARKQLADDTYKRRRWIPWALFLGGFSFLCIDMAILALGYPFFGLTCVMGVCWLAAILMGINLRKARMAGFHPDLKTAYDVIQTLRDDLLPKSVFLGHIDLTGSERAEKVSREQKDQRGRMTKLYSDEWLRLKAKLFDGNVLRISAIHKIKKRDSYFGRGSSGKNKLKPAKLKGDFQEFSVRIAVNPDMYEIIPSPSVQAGSSIGSYLVQTVDTNGGIVSICCATTKAQITANELLAVLKASYSLLKRKR
jgi:hypothetical protein